MGGRKDEFRAEGKSIARSHGYVSPGPKLGDMSREEISEMLFGAGKRIASKVQVSLVQISLVQISLV